MREYSFDTRDEASIAAAQTLARLIGRRLALQGEASLVVSGGTTPGRCFAELAATELDWQNVSVILSDERWVPPESDDSNERLVRETLIRDRAAEATLLPVYQPDTTPEARCEDMAKEVRSLPFPFAAALLGMGEDGHFASLFPDAPNLGEGLDTESGTLCLPVVTAASPHPRVSLSLSALSRSDEIVLLVFGEAKLSVIEAAREAESNLPIARLLRQKRAPVNVYWAP
jgi:6-phosphogluconolactonase